MDKWMHQDDVITTLMEMPSVLQKKWIPILSKEDTCLQANFTKICAVTRRTLDNDMARSDFTAKPAFEFYIQAPKRILPRLSYRRFHHLNSDGMRDSDRASLINTELKSDLHAKTFSMMFDNESLKEFLEFHGYGLIAHVHTYRYSERSLDELGLPKGQEKKVDEDFRFMRFFIEDDQIGRFRMRSASRCIAKRILLKPKK